ncbi:MAG: hypothetical protein WCL61_02520, partial [bacterium]
LEIIDQILNTIKERVETTANYLPPLLDAVGKLVNHFKEKREEKLEKEAEAEEKVEKKSKRK